MLKIDNLDGLEGLRSLESKSVDLIYYDPPYNAKKDYGVYKDDLPFPIYVKWMIQVLNESERVSRRGVAIYVDSIRFPIFYRTIFPLSDIILIWKKSPSRANNNVQGGFNAILYNCKPLKLIKQVWTDITFVTDGYFYRGEKIKGHPATTNLKATRRFISNFTEFGDFIVDPFIGTGTTLIACKQLERECRGFEINPKYIKIANKRSKQSGLFTYLR